MPTGTLTAYDLTTGVIVDMDEAIYMVSAQDSPMITGVRRSGRETSPPGIPRRSVGRWASRSRTAFTSRSSFDAARGGRKNGHCEFPQEAGRNDDREGTR